MLKLLWTIVLCVNAYSSVIYLNYTDTFSGPVVGVLGRSPLFGSAEAAASFIAPLDFRFTGAQVAVFACCPETPGPYDNAYFTLANDDNGKPGTPIDALNFIGPVPFTGTGLQIDSTLRPTLYAGNRYWLIGSHPPANPADLGPFHYLAWKLSPDDLSPIAIRYEAQQIPGEWQIFPGDQFGLRNLGTQISGDAVPEVSTFLLIAPALAILLLGRRITALPRNSRMQTY